MLEACDIGHRVVVRHRVGIRQTDVLGTLLAMDADRLLLRTDAGAEQSVPVSAVTAAKRVPPRPARYSEMLALEDLADQAWPALEQQRLGQWRLRAAQGWTNRANSALPLGDSGQPLTDTVAACVAFYQARGLPPKITVPLPVRRDVADHLSAAGWFAQPVVLVQAAPIETVAEPAADAVVLLDAPTPEFLDRLSGWKAALPPAALEVLTGVRPVGFAEVRDQGTLLATARGAVVREWLHLGLVEVDPIARRQGLAQRVSSAVARWGQGHGATRVVLQVEEDNAAAVALYRRMGFTTHHRYVTFRLD
jgi:ribosomal protein S18 acetylase RimI-like enzyme